MSQSTMCHAKDDDMKATIVAINANLTTGLIVSAMQQYESVSSQDGSIVTRVRITKDGTCISYSERVVDGYSYSEKPTNLHGDALAMRASGFL